MGVVRGEITDRMRLSQVRAGLRDLTTDETRAVARDGCRQVLEGSRRRRERPIDGVVDGGSWAAPKAVVDDTARGRVVEAQDILRADFGLNIELARDLIRILDGAINEGDRARARRYALLIDETLGQLRELRDQGLDALQRAQTGISQMETQEFLNSLRAVVRDDEYGLRVSPLRGRVRMPKGVA